MDNGLVIYKNKSQMDNFLVELTTEFQISSCDASYVLGLKITRCKYSTITVNQEAYIKQVLRCFNLPECNTITTPVDKGQDYCTASAV